MQFASREAGWGTLEHGGKGERQRILRKQLIESATNGQKIRGKNGSGAGNRLRAKNFFRERSSSKVISHSTNQSAFAKYTNTFSSNYIKRDSR